MPLLIWLPWIILGGLSGLSDPPLAEPRGDEKPERDARRQDSRVSSRA